MSSETVNRPQNLRLQNPVVTISHGVEVTDPPIPDGWVEIDAYHPVSIPWDVHGLRHQREYLYVLEEAGVIGLPLVTHHRRISPQGTGPGGRIRFGDDMMPGIYRIIVAVCDKATAEEAIKDHEARLKAWIYYKGPMPEACRKSYL